MGMWGNSNYAVQEYDISRRNIAAAKLKCVEDFIPINWCTVKINLYVLLSFDHVYYFNLFIYLIIYYYFIINYS